jgi:hypothetical protein
VNGNRITEYGLRITDNGLPVKRIRMTRKITVPQLGESVVEATVGQWHKQEGDTVAVGDILVELETDKVDVEVGAEAAGVLVSIKQQTGADVQIGEVLGEIEEGDGGRDRAEEQRSGGAEERGRGVWLSARMGRGLRRWRGGWRRSRVLIGRR